MPFILLILLAALAVLAPGCAVGPKYKAPEVEVPGEFRGAPNLPGSNTLAELPWWEFFKDERLKELIGTALTNNYDLRIALSRAEQAGFVAAQNRSLFFPQLGY